MTMAAPALKVRRPPDPRIASLRYARWARAVFEAWRSYVLAHPEASRAELEQAWANLTDRDQWERFFDVLAQVNENASKQYYVKLFKRAQPRPSRLPAVRTAWVDTQFELLERLGADQIDRLVQARAAHTGRTDAGDKLTPAQRAELIRIKSGERFGGSQGATVTQRALAKKGLIREGTSYPYAPELTEAGHAAIGSVLETAAALDPIAAARAENIALIKGTTEAQRASLGGLFKNAQAVGQRHETLVNEVQSILEIGRTRAKLIARDQTVKHNAAVNQAQAEASGVREYTWRSTHDQSCRPMHKALDGTVHTWDNPPVTNKDGDRNAPGNDYNCRCLAEPKLSQTQDLFAGLADPEFTGSLGF